MLEHILNVLLGVVLYMVMKWVVLKIKRRIASKKNLKANDYVIEFL